MKSKPLKSVSIRERCSIKDVKGEGSESELQSSIKQSLKELGYVALTTSTYNRVRRGAKEKGVPDILVTHKRWERGMWLGLEVKLPKGGIKPEQQALLDDGRIVIVRSWDEAWIAVSEKEAMV